MHQINAMIKRRKSLKYKYFDNDNFEDYSSGRVIYHRTGMTNFPVRLAGEVFCRCLEYIKRKNEITLYDPCCGSGYMVTVLGLMNIKTIKAIFASDISEDAINLTNKNLTLLSEDGLYKRKKQIEQMISQFKKPTYFESLKSVNKFISMFNEANSYIAVNAFTADILASKALINKDFIADVVITDVPYGNLVTWSDNSADPVNILLEKLLPVLSDNSVVAVITDKYQKVNHERYKKMERFKVGKRQITIMMIN